MNGFFVVEREGNDPTSSGFSDQRSDLISYLSICTNGVLDLLSRDNPFTSCAILVDLQNSSFLQTLSDFHGVSFIAFRTTYGNIFSTRVESSASPYHGSISRFGITQAGKLRIKSLSAGGEYGSRTHDIYLARVALIPTELIPHRRTLLKQSERTISLFDKSWLSQSHLRRALRCASRVLKTRMGRDNELPLAIVFRAFSRPWLTTKIANQYHGKVMTPCNKLLRCASDVLDHFTLPRQFKAARTGFEPASSFYLLSFGREGQT